VWLTGAALERDRKKASMAKVGITLDEQQQAELQMILADGDVQEALRFLREVVWGQVQAVRRKNLRGHMEQGVQ
jgi:hypothetical protein